MLDVFKGIITTAAIVALAVGWGVWDRSSNVIAHAVPVIAFVMPVLMRNRRWLIGCIGLFATGIVFVSWDVDGDRGAPFAYIALVWIAASLTLGVIARYLLLRLRAYLKRKIIAPSARASDAPAPAPPLPPITTRGVIFSACALAGVLIGYSLLVMQSAAASAEQIAAGRPYCLQIAQHDGAYRSVRSRLDLAGFYMLNRSAKHSVLVVNNAGTPEFHHWSYRHNGFVRDSYASLPIWCELAVNFLKHPRAFREESATTMQNFVLDGYGFSIPNEYAPVVSSNRTIALHADPPQFTASGVGSRWTHSNYVSVTIGRLGALSGWRQTPNDHYRVESLGEEHGLVKERVQSQPYRASQPAMYQYFELQPDGDVKTLVVCMESAATCTYMLSDGRFSYYFHHAASDLPNWRELQRTLMRTVAGFLASP